MTSKCGKYKKVAHETAAECVTDVLTTFLSPVAALVRSHVNGLKPFEKTI